MQIQAIEIDGRKFYQTPAGILPSVNTILDATATAEELEGLEKWRQKEKRHEEIRQESLARGTVLHELAEEFLTTGETTWIDSKIEPHWRSLLQYLETITLTATVSHSVYGGHRKAIELPVYHANLGYAGTLDWMGEVRAFPFELALTDFKSSRWYKNKPEYLLRHRLQIAAYRLAVEQLLGLEIYHRIIVIAVPKYRPQIVHLTLEQTEEDDALWLERLEQFQKRCAGGIAVCY